MSYYSDKIKSLKNLSNPYTLLYITAKVLVGVGIGILFANWLATWTWRIFIIIACLIAIPVVWNILIK